MSDDQPVTNPSDQDNGQQGAVTPPKAKESEPEPVAKSEEKILAEIKTTAETVDKQAEEAVRSAIAEAKQGQPEPIIPPDLADVGVISPPAEANKVVEAGTTLDLPISEASYQKGLHLRVAGAVVNGVVVGASSLAALAMWIGRIVKMAHKHAAKIIFRKGGL